jgi:type IV secretion system protein VirB4
MLGLRQFRDRAQAFSDLLNFALLADDGILQGKDGSLCAAWYYRGKDLGHCTHAELAATAAQINRALNMGSGWMLQVDAIRRHSMAYPGRERCHFPDRTSRVIDEERRALYEAEGHHFESRYALSLTFIPPRRIESRAGAYLYDEQDVPDTSPKGLASRILHRFKMAIEEFELTISSVLPLKRMKAVTVGFNDDGSPIVEDELLQYLEYTVSGVTRPVRLPPIPMYLDALIGCYDFVGGIEPKVGDNHIRVIAVDGYPQESFPGILGLLDNLRFQYRWNTRFIFLDPYEAKNKLAKVRLKWQGKQRGLMDQVTRSSKGPVDVDAVAMTSDAELAMGESESGLVRYGYHTLTLVLMDEDPVRLKESCDDAIRAIRNLGFGARVETINAIEAYLGSLPSHGFPNVRRPMLHTLNVADMLPITAVWAGLEAHPCPFYPKDSPPLTFGATSGATPFRICLHVGDVGHTLVLGMTGGGKSVLLSFLMAQHLRYKDAQIFAFDMGASSYVLNAACNGTFYDVMGPSTGIEFCPLKDIHLEEEQHWALDWLETCLELQGVTVTPGHRMLILDALRRLGAEENTSRTMTDLVAEIQDQELRHALGFYTLSGGTGRLFEAREDSLQTSNFTVFEMERAMATGERTLIPLLHYLFRQVVKRLTGRPTLIVMDECWVMLKHPAFSAKIEDWLRTFRRKNAAVVLATQSLSEVVNSSIRDIIIGQCPTKIYLPNKEAKDEHPRRLYESMGMNDREIEILATATEKREYYLRSPLGRRLFSLSLGPVALSFVAVSDAASLAIARDFVKTHPRDWPALWLEQRNLGAWGKFWREVT